MKIESGPIPDIDLTEALTTAPSGMQLGHTCLVGGVSGGQGEFVFGTANAAITAGHVSVANAGGYDFKGIEQADAEDDDPFVVAAVVTMADGEHAFFCKRHSEGDTYGSGTAIGVFVAASTAADAVLYVSGTKGILTSTGTTIQNAVDGVRLVTATGTTAAESNTTADFPFGMRIRER